MIRFEFFLLGLLIISTFTSLATEAVKRVLTEHKISYKANTLAGIISIVVAAVVILIYTLTNTVEQSASFWGCCLAMTCLAWLCAMVGYDKVMQAISQFKMDKKDEV